MRAVRVLMLVLVAAVGCSEGQVADSNPTAPTSQTPPPASCARPAAPGNLAASAVGSRVSFTWNAVTGANDYMLYVGTSSRTSNILSTNTTHTNYQWNGGGKGTYYARVETRNSCGSSDASNEVVVVITG